MNDISTETKYYLLYRQLQDLAEPIADNEASFAEMDEIDSVRKLVLEVSAEPPSFCTST